MVEDGTISGVVAISGAVVDGAAEVVGLVDVREAVVWLGVVLSETGVTLVVVVW